MESNAQPRSAVLRSGEFLGRDVLDADGSKIGAVRDLLLERRRGEIRFLEVDLGVFRKRVLIPVQRLDWGEESFVLREWKAQQIQRLPAYETDAPIGAELLDELVWAYPTFYGAEDDLPTEGPDTRVIPISDARDFRIPRGEHDPRGWNVFGADAERVGTVSDLLVDPSAMKVAYLSVDLLDDLFRLKDDRHVLVPIDYVDLRERGEDVWVRGLSSEEIARLPAYAGVAADPRLVRLTEKAFADTRGRESHPTDAEDSTHVVAEREDSPR